MTLSRACPKERPRFRTAERSCRLMSSVRRAKLKLRRTQCRIPVRNCRPMSRRRTLKPRMRRRMTEPRLQTSDRPRMCSTLNRTTAHLPERKQIPRTRKRRTNCIRMRTAQVRLIPARQRLIRKPAKRPRIQRRLEKHRKYRRMKKHRICRRRTEQTRNRKLPLM